MKKISNGFINIDFFMNNNFKILNNESFALGIKVSKKWYGLSTARKNRAWVGLFSMLDFSH